MQYLLILGAFDSLFEGNTSVRIRVRDINDLPPKFSQESYNTTILEEDNFGLPKRILKVQQDDTTHTVVIMRTMMTTLFLNYPFLY